MTDCIVVGGGLIGLLCARELSRAGLEVIVLERGKLGREASWAGGGILSPLYPWRYADAVTTLARWSQLHYPSLVEELFLETGIDPQYHQSGLLILDIEEQQQAQMWTKQTDTELYILDKAQLTQCEPRLSQAEQGAIWLPGIAQLRNPRLLQALIKSIAIQGVVIYEHTDVQRLELSNSSIAGVKTSQGKLAADKVVVAGGAWSGILLNNLGIQLGVEPVRGQMLLLRSQPGVITRIVLKKGHYVIPRKDGLVLVGSTVEYVGFDKAITSDAYAELHQAAIELFPQLASAEVEHHWSGLRPGSPQGIPYICEAPHIHGLFINTGHFRNGVVTGYASARLLAEIMLENRPSLDVRPFTL